MDHTWKDRWTNEQTRFYTCTTEQRWSYLLRNQNVLEILKNCSVCLSQKVGALFEGTLRSAMNGKIEIPTGNHGSIDNHSSHRKPLATYHTARYGPLLVPNTFLSAISPFLINVEAFPPLFLLYLIFRPYFKTEARPARGFQVSIVPVFRTRRRSSTRFLGLWIIICFVC